jgi:Holliday junction resolvase-like predicted endonuclease
MNKSFTHDKIISDLERRLIGYGHETRSCIEYRVNREVGEIDLFGISYKYNTIFSIEVKTTDKRKNRRKAKQQLTKDVKYLSRLYPTMDIISFYAYSAKNNRGYEVRRIKEIK